MLLKYRTYRPQLFISRMLNRSRPQSEGGLDSPEGRREANPKVARAASGDRREPNEWRCGRGGRPKLAREERAPCRSSAVGDTHRQRAAGSAEPTTAGETCLTDTVVSTPYLPTRLYTTLLLL